MTKFKVYSYRIYPDCKAQEGRMEYLLDLADNAFDELANKLNAEKKRGSSSSDLYTCVSAHSFVSPVSIVAAARVKKEVAKLIPKLVSGDIKSLFPRNRFRSTRHVDIPMPQIIRDRAKIEGVGYAKIVLHRPLPSDATVYRTTLKSACAGAEYYIDYAVRYEAPAVIPAYPNLDKVLGIDYTQDGLYVDSIGRSAGYPGFKALGQQKIFRLEAELQKHRKGSSRWKKVNLQLEKAKKHIERQRDDWQYKKAVELADNYDAVCHENLDFNGMIKFDPRLAKKISDNDWNGFHRKLSEKLEMRGKYLLEAPKYFPSSRICSRCGAHADYLPPNERVFVCGNCGLTIDRDHNAAIVLHDEGVKMLVA